MKVIGICDDEELAARRLERMIREMLGKRPELYGTEWEIRLYFSGEELLEEAGDCAVIFLDVKMPGMDGIETGRRIMIRYPSCKVTLATGERDRYKDGYRIHALRFVTKPFEEAEVAEALEAAVDIPGEREITVYDSNYRYVIREREIRYVIAYSGHVKIYTEKKVFRRNEGLEEFGSALDPRLFARPDRNLIVNLMYVDASSMTDWFTVGEQVFKISRRKKSDFRQACVDFDLKYRGRME